MRMQCAVAVFTVILAASAHAQRPGSIFVTPIPGAPFSGTIHVERTDILPNGVTRQLWSQRQIARDSTGRIYNEARPFLPMTMNQVPPVTVIHLYDPQNRMSELLYPQRKTYTMGIVNRPPETDTPDNFASTTSLSNLPSQYTRQDDLGNRTIAGLETHGVRITQTLPAAESGTGKEVTVTDEYWYAQDLRLNLMTRHDDSRTGSITMQVTQINRTAPDASVFGVPSDYTMGGMQQGSAQGPSPR